MKHSQPRVIGHALAALLAVVGVLNSTFAQTVLPPWTKVWPADTGTLVNVGDTVRLRWDEPATTSVSYGIEDVLVLRTDHLRSGTDPAPMDVHVRLRVDAKTNPDHGDYHKVNDEDTLFFLDFYVGVRGADLYPAGLDSLLADHDADAKIFLASHEFLLTLDTVEVDTGGGFVAQMMMPKSLFVDMQMTWAMVALMDLDEGPDALDTVTYGCHGRGEANARELEFHWDHQDGAVEYQLEWAWVDDYLADGDFPDIDPKDPEDISYDLDHNATRITTSDEHYRIPLLFDRGWIIWRVRGVGRDGVHPDVPIVSEWAGPDPSGDVDAARTACAACAVHVAGHQLGKNWQATCSYAEEGKQKEVVTYADGTSRAHQVVTRNNSLQVPIIGETVYDVVGRAAVQIMPVPLVNEGCDDIGDVAWAPIEYHPDFNLEHAGEEANVFNFEDLTAGGDCGITAPPLDNANGAEHYYSEAYMADVDPTVPPPSFLPKAEGYPYSQTEYTPDNTGRIRAQGGVGPQFQLGVHDTRNYYGKPEQIQLDRLFGSEAGYAEHYQKNVQIDANGQVTVTYVDMAGHTVATALSCGAPAQMDEVGSEDVTLTTDLFDGMAGTDPNLHQLQPEGPTLFFTTQIAVPCAGNYSFEYKVTSITLEDNCEDEFALCPHCVYDLDIVLTDPCHVEVASVHDIVGTLDLEDDGVMFNCESPQEEQVFTITPEDPLQPGEYTLTKILRVHDEAREYYVQYLLDDTHSGCIHDLAYFHDIAEGEVNVDDCYLDCNQCYDALGSEADFVGSGQGSAADYQLLLAECDEMCAQLSWCDIAYQNMLADMTLQGQYCTAQLNNSGDYEPTDRTSVLYFGDGTSVLLPPFLGYTGSLPWRTGINGSIPLWRQPWLDLADGTHVLQYHDMNGYRTRVLVTMGDDGHYHPELVHETPTYLEVTPEGVFSWPENLVNVNDFIHAWEPGWERSLVRFHPEYCYYVECKGYADRTDPDLPHTSSDGFDAWLDQTTSWASAVTEGLLDGSGVPQLLTLDPFVTSTAYPDYSNELIDRFNDYVVIDGVHYSMPEAAAVQAYCQGQFDVGMLPMCTDFPNPPTGQMGDAAWANLRAYYRSEKYKIQKKKADAYVSTCECSSLNYCIGQEHTSSWWNKMHSPNPYSWTWWAPDSYADWYAAFNAAWNSQPGHMDCQACNDSRYQWFKDKARRVQDPTLMPGSDLSPMDAAYEQYMQTGQCPVATAWQTLLEQIREFPENSAPDHLLESSSSIHLNTFSAWQGVVLALNNFEPGTPVPDALFSSYVSGDDLFITIDYPDGPDCNIEIDDAPSDFWHNVIYIAGISAGDDPGEFTLTAYYTDPSTHAQHVVELAGTGMCDDLAPCNFPRQCQPNDLAFQFQSLFNMLAQRNILDDVSGTTLSSVGVPGSSSPSIQAALGASIVSRFPTGYSLKWDFDGTDLWLRDGASSALYHFTDLATEPSLLSVSAYLALAGHFENITSAYENGFEVDVYDNDGNYLCRLSGALWFDDGEHSSPLPMGTCDLPPTLTCQQTQYQLLPELMDVLKDIMEAGYPDFTDAIDLWESPSMTAELGSAICPTCDAAWKIDGVPELVQEWDDETGEITFGDCMVIDIDPPSGATTFTSLGDPELIGVPDENGLVNEVNVPVYNGALFQFNIHIHLTCFGVKECDPCPQDVDGPPEEDPEHPERMFSEEDVYTDSLWDGFAEYRAAVDSLNAEYGTEEVPVARRMSYPEYRRQAYQYTLATYLRYIRNYRPEVDDTLFLQQPDSFVVRYGHAVNVKQEYGRYARAVADYNARATVAEKPLMDVEPDSTFAQLVVADNIHAYVTDLLDQEPQSEVPLDLESYYAEWPGDTTACRALYTEQYLPAYAWFESHNSDSTARCPNYAVFSPLYGFEDFKNSNLCCSDSGRALLDNYLALFYADSGECPGPLPLVKICDPEPPMGMRMLMEEETDCERFYVIWLSTLLDFNSSVYSAKHDHVTLTSPYTDFEKFQLDSLCGCIEAYLAYLQPYLDWHEGDPDLPKPMQLKEFCKGYENPCCVLLDSLLAMVKVYDKSKYHDELDMPDLVLSIEDCDDMLESGYCDCLPGYIEYLQQYIDWEPGDDPLPEPVDISIVCGPGAPPPEELCSHAYEIYTDGIIAMEELLDYVNSYLEYPKTFKILEEKEFDGYCYCVDGYLAHAREVLERIRLALKNGEDIDQFTDELAEEDIWDIRYYCKEPTPCPPPTPQDPIPQVSFPEEDDGCEQGLLATIDLNAHSLYEQYLDTLVRDIRARYDSTCMTVLEQFRMTFPNNEHHFTLYYYDQAGSLVRTVPPAGVEVDESITDPDDDNEVAIVADRNNGTHELVTLHRMASDHAFNSLGQPVRSAMPDQDNMDIWETALPSGLPPELNITSSWFGEGGRGYLTGFIKLGTITRAQVYSTADGGVTWTRSPGLLGTDLTDVHFPDASDGYAVGNNGTFVRSTDDGGSWDLVPNELLGDGTALTGVAFHDNANGVVVGPGSYSKYTTDGGDSFDPKTTPASMDLTGAGDDAGTYVATAISNSGESGTVLTSSSVSGAWIETGKYGTLASDLNTASVNGSYPVYAAGKNGVLLTSSNGDDWQTLPTGTTEKFISIWFKDATHGVAIMDSVAPNGVDHIGVLRRTSDNGQHWIPIGHPEYNLTDLFAYQPSGTNAELVAVGNTGDQNNGIVIRVLMYGDEVGIVPIIVPTTAHLYSVWAGYDGSALRCLLGDENGKVLCGTDLLQPHAIWSPSGVLLASHRIIDIAGNAASNVVRAVLRTDNDKRIDFRWQLTTAPTFSNNTASSTWGGLCGLGPSDPGHAAMFCLGDQNLFTITLSGAPPYSASSTAPSGKPDSSHLLKALVTVSSGVVVGAGDNGSLYKAATLPSYNWSDRRAHVQPLPLRSIDKTGKVAVGDQGTIYYNNSGTWCAVQTPSARTLRAVSRGTSIVAVAGDGGAFFRFPYTTPTSYTQVDVPTSPDLRSAAMNASALTLGTSDGRMFYVANISSPVFAEMPFNGGAVQGLALHPGTDLISAVGEGSLMQQVSVTTRVPQDVNIPRLLGIHFADNGNGYAVGAYRLARHTTDGGQHWHALPNAGSLPLPRLNAVFTTAPDQAWAVGESGTAFTYDHLTLTPQSGFSTTDLQAITFAPSGAGVIAGQHSGDGKYYTHDAGGSFGTAHTVTGDPLYAVWAFPRLGTKDEFIIGGDGSTATRLVFPGGSYNSSLDAPSTFSSGIDIRAFWFHDHVSGMAIGPDGSLAYLSPTTDVDHTVFAWGPPGSDRFTNADQSDAHLIVPATIGFSSRHLGFVGGVYTSSPTETCFARTIRDESQLYSQRLWYDVLGRVVLSQNSKQFDPDADPGTAWPKLYSYSFYDALGRVEEAGQVEDPGTIVGSGTDPNASTIEAVFGASVNGQQTPSVIDANTLRAWVLADGRARTEVVHTYYDKEAFSAVQARFTGGHQGNLRLRVASTTYKEFVQRNTSLDPDDPNNPDDPDDYAFDHATHYSYDIHGNVKELVQDIPQMAIDLAGDVTDVGRYKRMKYTYDLVSANVKQVDYQPGKLDQMHHRYTYDADNRITEVETSVDGHLWYPDANYFYYPHGPLERTELGRQVQGLDYAYTLQGWLKGINSDQLTPERDMGLDGVDDVANPRRWFGRDAFGTSIGYNAADYVAIDGDRWDNSGDHLRPFAPHDWNAGDNWAGLFNGNIAHVINSLQPFPDADGAWADVTGHRDAQVLAQIYHYDQLNRLKEMRARTGLDANNDWGTLADPTDPVAKKYMSKYWYYADGDIKGASRWDQDGERYDELYYDYQKDGSDNQMRHRLYQLSDAQTDDGLVNATDDGVEDLPYALPGFTDPDGSLGTINTENNYGYDALGQLVRDDRENIANVAWTVAGKVAAVDKSSGQDLSFHYGGDGQRISKTVGDVGDDGHREFYVRDAQGNIMAMYNYAPGTFKVTERPVYGSQRAGQYAKQAELMGVGLLPFPYTQAMYTTQERYELTDHLGNVCTVLTGRTLSGNGAGSLRQAEVVNAQGYEPFGSLLPGRNFSSDSYRFGFQGQEKDDEIHGATGTSISYEYRMHDPRVGRFLSIDPLAGKYAHQSPYAFSSNRVIDRVEMEGLEDAKFDIIERNNWQAAKALHPGDFEAQSDYVRKCNDAAGAGAILGVAIVADVVFTKGRCSQFVWYTMLAGTFEHNKATTPQGQAMQEQRANANLTNLMVGYGTARLATAIVAPLIRVLVSDGRVLQTASIRSSQGTVNNYDRAVREIQSGTYDPIDIVRMKDGIYTTVDNTRLIAAENLGVDVKATAHTYEEALPESMSTRFANPDGSGQYAKTWGEAVEFRTNDQSAAFRKAYGGTGTFVRPKINSR